MWRANRGCGELHPWHRRIFLSYLFLSQDKDLDGTSWKVIYKLSHRGPQNTFRMSFCFTDITMGSYGLRKTTKRIQKNLFTSEATCNNHIREDWISFNIICGVSSKSISWAYLLYFTISLAKRNKIFILFFIFSKSSNITSVYSFPFY